jgi:murein DD-endopeptidase MepM/ murein hydrolase activator NlpD
MRRTSGRQVFAAMAAVLALAHPAAAPAQGTPLAQEVTPTALVGDVLFTPRPLPGSDGARHLVYELRLSNVTGAPVTLKRVAVFADQDAEPLKILEPAEIAGRFSPAGRRGNESAELAGYQYGIGFLHVVLPAGRALPRQLRHEIEARFDQFKAEAVVRLEPVAIADSAPPVLGPPLRGKGYIAGDGCCDSTRHVRALLPLDGGFHLAQRFAIDWEKIDAEGRIFTGDRKQVANYHIYGEPVLAVSDGTVVDMRNDLPDQVPGALPDGLPVSEADGNFVVLDIGGGAFVLYAHMQPGSVRVKAGDRLRRGDVIGAVGNSGNSSEPHLHLHVTNGPSPLLSDGIPYVFDSVTVTAVDQQGTADFDRATETGSPVSLTPVAPPLAVRGALPLDLSVVDWAP